MPTTPQQPRLTWSRMKVSRAEKHLAALQADVAIWASTRPFEAAAAMRPGRLGYDVRLKVPHPPPLGEWALALGDVVHNLRSALDAAVWQFVTANDPTPLRPTLVQFPIVSTTSSWAEAKKRLPGVSASLVDAIWSLQPFNRPEKEQAGDGLLVLQHLSNVDKHRVAISASVVPQSAEWNATIEFGEEVDAARNVPPDVTIHAPVILNGALLLEHRTLDPIKAAPGGFNLGFQVSVDTVVGLQPMGQTLAGLCSYVRQILLVLESEALSAEEQTGRCG